ncbi:MAG: hypothetical protein WCE94_09210 [Candidatus Methanoperedens sp.]
MQYIVGPTQQTTSTVQTTWNPISAFLSGLWNGLAGIATTAFNAVKTNIINPITDAYNTLKGICGNIYDLVKGTLDKVAEIGGKIAGAVGHVIDVGKQATGQGAKAASGGVFTTATDLTVGEAGAEAVVPLTGNRGSEVLAQAAQMGYAVTTPGSTVGYTLGSKNIGKRVNVAMTPSGTMGMLQWMATGGIVTSPTVIGAGDNGPEAIIPLTTLTDSNKLIIAGLNDINKSVCNLCTITYNTGQAIAAKPAVATPHPPVPAIPWWVVNPPQPYTPPNPAAPKSPITIGGGYTPANYQIPQPLMPTFNLSDMPPEVLAAMMQHLEASYGFQYANLTPQQQQTAWTTIQDQINRIIQSRMPALLMQFVPDFPAMVPYVQKAALDWVKGYIIAEIGKPGLTVGGGDGQYAPFDPNAVPLPPGVNAAGTTGAAAKARIAQFQTGLYSAQFQAMNPGVWDQLPDYMRDAAVEYQKLYDSNVANGYSLNRIQSWGSYVQTIPSPPGIISEATVQTNAIIDAAKKDAIYQGLSNQFYKDQYIQYKLMVASLLKQGWTLDQIEGWDKYIAGVPLPAGVTAQNTTNTLLKAIKDNLPKSIADPIVNYLKSANPKLLDNLTKGFDMLTGAIQTIQTAKQGISQIQQGLNTIVSGIKDIGSRIKDYYEAAKSIVTSGISIYTDIQSLMNTAPTAVDYTQLDQYKTLLDAMDKSTTANAQYLGVLAYGDPKSQKEVGMLAQAQTDILNDMKTELQDAAAQKQAEATAQYQSDVQTKLTNLWNDLKGGFSNVSSLLTLMVGEITGQGFMSSITSSLGGFGSILNGIITLGGVLGSLTGGVTSLINLLGPLITLLGGTGILTTLAGAVAGPLATTGLTGTLITALAPTLISTLGGPAAAGILGALAAPVLGPLLTGPLLSAAPVVGGLLAAPLLAAFPEIAMALALSGPAVAPLAALPAMLPALVTALTLAPILAGPVALPAMLPALVTALTLAPIGLAEGGVVHKPTLSMIGEKGTEYIIPENKLPGFGVSAGATNINFVIKDNAIRSDADIDSIANQVISKVNTTMDKKMRMMGVRA